MIPAGTDGGLSFGNYNSPIGGPFTGPTHTYEDTGVFTVTFGAYVIDGPDTCKYEVATQQILINDSLISVIELTSQRQYVVYPNPNVGTFTIELSGFTKEEVLQTRLCVRNIIGQKVPFESSKKGDGSISLELISKQKGIYFIEITGTTSRTTVKVVVN